MSENLYVTLLGFNSYESKKKKTKIMRLQTRKSLLIVQLDFTVPQ